MRVTALGHASVLIEMGHECVVVDPIFDEVFASGTLCLHPPREVDAQAIIEMATVLVVTHIHLDHFHPATLCRFPRHLPLIIPPHAALMAAVSALGFTHVTTLQPWSRHALSDGALLATPSDFEFEEFGLLAVAGADSYWHMSDAIVSVDVGTRVRTEIGPVSLVSVKFQPLRTLIAYQRGLASAVLDKDDLTSTFEAACAVEPACLFPYYSGFAFHGDHAWANRYISPFRAHEAAALLRRRLGDASTVLTVLPGHTFEIAARSVESPRATRALVSPREAAEVQSWEPIDPTTLAGIGTLDELLWLTLDARRLLLEEVLPWVEAHLDAGSGMFDAYREFQAVWQCVIHLGPERRLRHCIDFRRARPTLIFDQLHPAANIFTHVSGGCLLQVLRRQAGPEVFWMAGAYRMYEKILYLDGGRLRAPPYAGWDLYEHMPDPLTHYLRKVPRPSPRA